MRKIIYLIALIAVQNSFSQEKASVEKSIFGVQAGLFGVWAHNECRLTNSLALRSEIGLDVYAITNSATNDIKYYLTPAISVEPRWYYNLEKRNRKGKNILKNSGNFITLGVYFHPDLFTIPNDRYNFTPSQISFIPKWGFKRTIVKHLTYEANVGVGYIAYVQKHPYNTDDLIFDLQFKIGYTF